MDTGIVNLPEQMLFNGNMTANSKLKQIFLLYLEATQKMMTDKLKTAPL